MASNRSWIGEIISVLQSHCQPRFGTIVSWALKQIREHVSILYYLIVESVSFVLLWYVSPINPKKTIEIIKG